MNDTKAISANQINLLGPKDKANQKEMNYIELLADIPDEFVGEDLQHYGPFNKGQIVEIPEKNAKILIGGGIARESTLTDSKTVNTVNGNTNKTNPLIKNTVNTVNADNTVNSEIKEGKPFVTVNETVNTDNKTVNNKHIYSKNEINSSNSNNRLTVGIDKAKFHELYVSRIRKDLGIQRRASIFLIESFIESESMSREEITGYLISKGVTKTTAYQVPTDLKKAKILIEDNGRFSMNPQRINELLEEYTRDVSPDADQVIIDDDFKDWIKSILNESGELEVDLDLTPEKYKTMALQDPDKFLGEVSQNDPRPKPGEIKVKFINMPGPRKLLSHTIRAEFILNLIEIKGTTFALTNRIPRITEAIYSCERCGEYHTIYKKNILEDPPKPITCTNPACGRNGPFKLMEGYSKFTDVKMATVRSEGDDSNGLLVVFKDEDALLIRRGMLLKVQGILRRKKINSKKGETSFYYLEAINFEEMHHKDQIYDKEEVQKYLEDLDKSFLDYFKKSAFPRIAGMDAAKEAFLLSLVSPHWHERGPEREGFERDNINILVVSDYGQAKGMFQRYIKDLEDVEEISGGHCTQAGLISATINDPETGFYLTFPGALPKSDGKHIVINELQNVPIELMANLREAIEDGITNVNKANSSEKITSRVTVIAFANYSKGNIDRDKVDNPRLQIKWLDPGFSSRFDLILFVYDDLTEDDPTKKIFDAKKNKETDIKTIQEIKKVIAYMRDLNPVIPTCMEDKVIESTNELLKSFNNKYVTISRGRLIRSIDCVSRAYARINNRETVEVVDINRAKNLIAFSLECNTALNMSLKEDEEKAQVELMTELRKIIETNQAPNKGARFEDIRANIEKGIPDNRIRRALEELININAIITPTKGEYKLS